MRFTQMYLVLFQTEEDTKFDIHPHSNTLTKDVEWMNENLYLMSNIQNRN